MQFLVWLTSSGRQSDLEAGKAAFTTFLEQHTDSKGLEKITDNFPYLAPIFDKKRATGLLPKVNPSPCEAGPHSPNSHRSSKRPTPLLRNSLPRTR